MVPTHCVGMVHGVKLPKCSGVSLWRGPSACDAKDCPVHFPDTSALVVGQPDWCQEAGRATWLVSGSLQGCCFFELASDLIVDLRQRTGKPPMAQPAADPFRHFSDMWNQTLIDHGAKDILEHTSLCIPQHRAGFQLA